MTTQPLSHLSLGAYLRALAGTVDKHTCASLIERAKQADDLCVAAKGALNSLATDGARIGMTRCYGEKTWAECVNNLREAIAGVEDHE